MRYKAVLLFAVILMLSVTAVLGRSTAAPPEKATTQQKMQSVDYLLGTWNCTHTVGTFSGTYTTTFSRALGDFWLKQTYDFPPQKTADRNDPRITAEALMGFDEPRQTWVRFFANSLGQYFSIRMTDTENGWAWKYSTFFVRTKPETPDPDAKFIKKSNTEYMIEGPTYPEGGTLVTEHHTCHKM
jgi:hypothetical protein